jgi:hypothetical protein
MCILHAMIPSRDVVSAGTYSGLTLIPVLPRSRQMDQAIQPVITLRRINRVLPKGAEWSNAEE